MYTNIVCGMYLLHNCFNHRLADRSVFCILYSFLLVDSCGKASAVDQNKTGSFNGIQVTVRIFLLSESVLPSVMHACMQPLLVFHSVVFSSCRSNKDKKCDGRFLCLEALAAEN